MNIAILSMQRVNNFGSLLQSYSLKTILEEQGHQVFFLDIKPIKDDDRLMDSYRKHYKSDVEGSGLISKIKKIDRYTINRIRIKKESEYKKCIGILKEFHVESIFPLHEYWHHGYIAIFNDRLGNKEDTIYRKLLKIKSN